jgi:hypothetical protein
MKKIALRKKERSLSKNQEAEHMTGLRVKAK